MGKTDKRRPSRISRAEDDLRWAYAMGRLSLKEFTRKSAKLSQDDLLRRSGRVIKA